MASSVDLTSFPTARNDATESSYAKMAEAYQTSGVIWNVGSEFACFGDSTGMHVKVPSGRGVINGTYGDSTSTQTLDIATADATNPRIDRVVLRLTTTSPATVSLHVITGTAATSPTPPTLLNNSTNVDAPIAKVAVGAAVSTITSANVTTERQMAGDLGWQTGSPTIYAMDDNGTGINWAAPDPQTDSGNIFTWHPTNMSCHVHVVQKMKIDTGSGYSYAFLLPYTAAGNGYHGPAIVQNLMGFALTVARSGAIGLSGSAADLAQIRKYDSSTLTTGGSGYGDGFDLIYQIAPR